MPVDISNWWWSSLVGCGVNFVERLKQQWNAVTPEKTRRSGDQHFFIGNRLRHDCSPMAVAKVDSEKRPNDASRSEIMRGVSGHSIPNAGSSQRTPLAAAAL